MNKEDICYMSACDMLEKIKTQELSSLEITETIIERIEKINPSINAYCTTTFELARDMAKKADQRLKNGEKLPPLNGIPTSIKDLLQISGIKTTFGCKFYENFVSEEDEIAVKRLRDAGAVFLGKTNTPAFGHVAVTYNLIFGTTLNPWNLERTSGGSSGGAGAAVASGLGPLALGSDGGGSVRIPSCFCGIYGLKPSFGRVPRNLHGTIGWATLDHYGPLVRYVKDAALMLDILKGPDESDRFTLPKQDISYLNEIEDIPKKLKIGYSIGLGFVKAVDSEVEKYVLNAAQKFEECEWTVEEAKVKIKKPELTFNTLVTAGLGFDLQSFLKEKEKLDGTLVKMIEAGLSYSAIDLKKAESQREEIFDVVSNHFKNYDILITPSTAVPAFGLGMMYPPTIAGKGVSPVAWMSYTYPFNMTGNPAASIPCGWSNEGLPIGMQIIGKRFDDLTVLQASKAFENIQPWQSKRPNL
jgi:Asp-tRNA(Asn)/Glu-tRNA(Gln) amidotransferase A subunit family amidase